MGQTVRRVSSAERTPFTIGFDAIRMDHSTVRTEHRLEAYAITNTVAWQRWARGTPLRKHFDKPLDTPESNVAFHEKSDLSTFRLFSTQLVINGNATQAEISRAFGVPLVTVKRYVKLYRETGVLRFLPLSRSARPAN